MIGSERRAAPVVWVRERVIDPLEELRPEGGPGPAHTRMPGVPFAGTTCYPHLTEQR